MDYLWLSQNLDTPILQQAGPSFHSAALLFHPFVQMPNNWAENKRQHPHEHVYPTTHEQLTLGTPIRWQEMLKKTGLVSYQQLAISLLTSISALNEATANEQWAKQLNEALNEGFFYPLEDTISVFLFEQILTLFKQIGSTHIHYINPILNSNGTIELASATPERLGEVTRNVCLLTDDLKQLAFINSFDTFVTVMLWRDEHIEQLMGEQFEYMVCDESTSMCWWFQD